MQIDMKILRDIEVFIVFPLHRSIKFSFHHKIGSDIHKAILQNSRLKGYYLFYRQIEMHRRIFQEYVHDQDLTR